MAGGPLPLRRRMTRSCSVVTRSLGCSRLRCWCGQEPLLFAHIAALSHPFVRITSHPREQHVCLCVCSTTRFCLIIIYFPLCSQYIYIYIYFACVCARVVLFFVLCVLYRLVQLVANRHSCCCTFTDFPPLPSAILPSFSSLLLLCTEGCL